MNLRDARMLIYEIIGEDALSDALITHMINRVYKNLVADTLVLRTRVEKDVAAQTLSLVFPETKIIRIFQESVVWKSNNGFSVQALKVLPDRERWRVAAQEPGIGIPKWFFWLRDRLFIIPAPDQAGTLAAIVCRYPDDLVGDNDEFELDPQAAETVVYGAAADAMRHLLARITDAEGEIRSRTFGSLHNVYSTLYEEGKRRLRNRIIMSFPPVGSSLFARIGNE